MSSAELSWVELSWAVLSWVELCLVELSWAELSWVTREVVLVLFLVFCLTLCNLSLVSHRLLVSHHYVCLLFVSCSYFCKIEKCSIDVGGLKLGS